MFGVERSHGTPMYRLVEAGRVDPRRYVREVGIRAVVERALEVVVLPNSRPAPASIRP